MQLSTKLSPLPIQMSIPTISLTKKSQIENSRSYSTQADENAETIGTPGIELNSSQPNNTQADSPATKM